ncbi:Pseudaminic acid cytidylyltransferase [hydrothermal vent metagenome]|uniref:Pseudaminic acid cytidylyltransferase n=1 Tax=hydrothermal vent metagenome TaxID=652676 RepID=A0A3B0VMP4_9ZZZZ
MMCAMKVVIRVDASLQIGTGHVMRCLTLAEALKKQGRQVVFICREHTGHLMDVIQQKGFDLYALPCIEISDVERRGIETKQEGKTSRATCYGDWLGGTQEQDSQACLSILNRIQPTWLVVDHYAIDENWEKSLQETYQFLMVVDDLANRNHLCDLLLDQTYGRKSDEYVRRVPEHCTLLLGAQNALLRPEFLQWRACSLQRRQSPVFEKLLITLGGMDTHNVTVRLLNALIHCSLPAHLEITVVMGANAPNLPLVLARAETMPYSTCIKVGVTNMAELMTESDLVISAAGATTWEVACLGVPLILLQLADNQATIMTKLSAIQAVLVWGIKQLEQDVQMLEKISPPLLKRLSNILADLSDAKGVERVVNAMAQTQRLPV